MVSFVWSIHNFFVCIFGTARASSVDHDVKQPTPNGVWRCGIVFTRERRAQCQAIVQVFDHHVARRYPGVDQLAWQCKRTHACATAATVQTLAGLIALFVEVAGSTFNDGFLAAKGPRVAPSYALVA